MPPSASARATPRTHRLLLVLLLAALLPACSLLSGHKEAPAAQAEQATPADAARARARRNRDGPPAFDIRVESPDADIQELVEKYNELRRFRAVRDLEPVELQRLVALEDGDVRKLVATEGYFSPTIHITQEEQDGRPLVTIRVDPGPPTRVASVALQFKGDIATSSDPGAVAQKEAIVEDWSLGKGRRFTEDRWSSAKSAALKRLLELRYPRAELESSQADIDPATAAAHLHVELNSGPAFHLGPAVVRRAQRYPADLAPRLSWLKPGQVYEQKKLIDAQGRLATSGYYRSAYISIDPAGDPAAAPVKYLLTEEPPKKLQFGLGYSTDSGPRASIEHRNNRFFGSDWRSETKLEINRKTPLVQFGLTGLPNAHGWRRGGLVRYMVQDDGTLTTTSQALRLGITKAAERYDRNLFLQFDHATVSGSDGHEVPAALLGDGAAVSANYNWTGRYFNNMFSPTRGWGLGLDTALGVTTIGPKRPFARLDGRWLGLLPLSKTLGFLSLRTEAGAVLSSKDARIPAPYLFRTGGDTTVRGYSFRSIGIPVGSGLVAPGRYMAVASAEWVHPILQRRMPGLLDQVFFVDYGSVARHVYDLRPHWGVGTGVRANTPVGPMEIDLAYGLQSKSLHIHMNVGFTF